MSSSVLATGITSVRTSSLAALTLYGEGKCLEFEFLDYTLSEVSSRYWSCAVTGCGKVMILLCKVLERGPGSRFCAGDARCDPRFYNSKFQASENWASSPLCYT
jgi:hypothetical protein